MEFLYKKFVYLSIFAHVKIGASMSRKFKFFVYSALFDKHKYTMVSKYIYYWWWTRIWGLFCFCMSPKCYRKILRIHSQKNLPIDFGEFEKYFCRKIDNWILIQNPFEFLNYTNQNDRNIDVCRSAHKSAYGITRIINT